MLSGTGTRLDKVRTKTRPLLASTSCPSREPSELACSEPTQRKTRLKSPLIGSSPRKTKRCRPTALTSVAQPRSSPPSLPSLLISRASLVTSVSRTAPWAPRVCVATTSLSKLPMAQALLRSPQCITAPTPLAQLAARRKVGLAQMQTVIILTPATATEQRWHTNRTLAAPSLLALTRSLSSTKPTGLRAFPALTLPKSPTRVKLTKTQKTRSRSYAAPTMQSSQV